MPALAATKATAAADREVCRSERNRDETERQERHARREQPARRSGLTSGENTSACDDKHDQTALGEHHADPRGIHAENLLAAQRQSDLERADQPPR